MIEKCKSLLAAKLCSSSSSFSSRICFLDFYKTRKQKIPEPQYCEDNRGFICKLGTTESHERNRREERNNSLEDMSSYFNLWKTVTLYSTVKSTTVLRMKRDNPQGGEKGKKICVINGLNES